jgi:hypothetical protein
MFCMDIPFSPCTKTISTDFLYSVMIESKTKLILSLLIPVLKSLVLRVLRERNIGNFQTLSWLQNLCWKNSYGSEILRNSGDDISKSVYFCVFIVEKCHECYFYTWYWYSIFLQWWTTKAILFTHYLSYKKSTVTSYITGTACTVIMSCHVIVQCLWLLTVANNTYEFFSVA